MILEKIPVSIIIPTYNRVLKLFRLLKSLDKLSPIPDEIIIVDDNSKDKTKDLLIIRNFPLEIIGFLLGVRTIMGFGVTMIGHWRFIFHPRGGKQT